MINVTFERSRYKPSFKSGEIVELIPWGDQYPYIVMVAKDFGSSFQGTVIYDEGEHSLTIGSVHNNFDKDKFTKFKGKLTMENK